MITRSLRERTVLLDATFDLVFPAVHRFRSYVHWTPVDVALRAVALLAPANRERVLDVGSGVGKLCLVGAATTTGATWYGIERDAAMVRAAQAAAQRLRIDDRTRFIHGEMSAIDWAQFDAFYLFNPFAEILTAGTEDPLARRDRYAENVELVQAKLAATRPGTRVVTYYGFGSDPPPDFACVHREVARGDELRVWLKRSARRSRRVR